MKLSHTWFKKETDAFHPFRKIAGRLNSLNSIQFKRNSIHRSPTYRFSYSNSLYTFYRFVLCSCAAHKYTVSCSETSKKLSTGNHDHNTHKSFLRLIFYFICVAPLFYYILLQLLLFSVPITIEVLILYIRFTPSASDKFNLSRWTTLRFASYRFCCCLCCCRFYCCCFLFYCGHCNIRPCCGNG